MAIYNPDPLGCYSGVLGDFFCSIDFLATVVQKYARASQFFSKLSQIKPEFLNPPCNPGYNETFHLIYMTIKSNLIDLINLACR